MQTENKKNDIISITTFRQVTWEYDRPVCIFCDIDDTVISDKESMDRAFALSKEEPDDIKRLELYYRELHTPYATDLDGFQNMMERLSQSDPSSEFSFLTARGCETHSITLEHLQMAGIPNGHNHRVYYTNNWCTKGVYMRDSIFCLSSSASLPTSVQYIFIDDNELHLKSVHELFPQIQCYRWRTK